MEKNLGLLSDLQHTLSAPVSYMHRRNMQRLFSFARVINKRLYGHYPSHYPSRCLSRYPSHYPSRYK